MRITVRIERRGVVRAVMVGALVLALVACGGASRESANSTAAPTGANAAAVTPTGQLPPDGVGDGYDAAVGDVMVFCEIVGRFNAAWLRSTASRVPGVRPGSVRVSTDFAALSFAVDPKHGSPLSAVQAAGRAIGPTANLKIVRVTSAAFGAGSP